jgi:hypothetical protein
LTLSFCGFIRRHGQLSIEFKLTANCYWQFAVSGDRSGIELIDKSHAEGISINKARTHGRKKLCSRSDGYRRLLWGQTLGGFFADQGSVLPVCM